MRYEVVQRILFGGSVLWPAEMAHEDRFAAVGEDLFDGGDGGADAGVVGNIVFVIKRDVEVDPDEGFFVGKGMLGELAHNRCWVQKKAVCIWQTAVNLI